MATQDFRLEDDFDLAFANGDLKILDSQDQEIKLITVISEGDLKQYPLFGVGIVRFQHSILKQELKNKIRTSLVEDGFNVKDISIKNNDIEINAVK